MNTSTRCFPGIALAALLVGTIACGGSGESPEPRIEPAASPSGDSESARLYRDNDCGLCHGENREGTDLGPPLRDLGTFWDTDRLTTYLENPLAFHEAEPRFLESRTQFEMEMPPFDHLTVEERRALATWLLAE